MAGLQWDFAWRDYRIDRCRGQFRGVIAFVLLLFLLGSGGACVTTAECDDVVECGSGQACYDFECKTRCDLEGASCTNGETCEPCEQDDPSGQIDHCPDRDRGAFVCLAEDS